MTVLQFLLLTDKISQINIFLKDQASRHIIYLFILIIYLFQDYCQIDFIWASLHFKMNKMAVASISREYRCHVSWRQRGAHSTNVFPHLGQEEV